MPKANLSEMAKRWPSPYVARQEVKHFSGGIISEKYLANLDCQGRGPARIKVGRKIAYRADDLVTWLEARSNVEE